MAEHVDPPAPAHFLYDRIANSQVRWSPSGSHVIIICPDLGEPFLLEQVNVDFIGRHAREMGYDLDDGEVRICVNSLLGLRVPARQRRN